VIYIGEILEASHVTLVEQYEKQYNVFLCLCSGESKSDDDLILRNGDIRQVWRLDTEVCHIDSAGRGSCNGIANNFPLHIKDFFVGFAMHCQVASQLKMNRLPIAVARR